MDKTTKATVAASVGELIIGTTLGIFTSNLVYPKCNKPEKVIVFLGTLIGGWYMGRQINKSICEACDERFGSEYMEAMGYK